MKIIKKDGSRVPFDRERIRAGLEKALYKRPISDEQVSSLVGQIEATIYEHQEREIPSRDVGEIVIEALKDIDHVAYVRFASVYRDFKDVQDFVSELQPMLTGNDTQKRHIEKWKRLAKESKKSFARYGFDRVKMVF